MGRREHGDNTALNRLEADLRLQAGVDVTSVLLPTQNCLGKGTRCRRRPHACGGGREVVPRCASPIIPAGSRLTD